MHTIIVGNGIIALATAFRLLQRLSAGDAITIVGESERSGSATMAAAAMLNAFAELDTQSLQNEVDHFRFELSHRATREWPRFEQELIAAAGDALPSVCRQCQGFSGGGCVSTGTYLLANVAGGEADRQNLAVIRQVMQAMGEPCLEVSPEAIPGYRPATAFSAQQALHLPNEGWINPRIVMDKLERLLRQSPAVQFVSGMVKKLHCVAGRVANVQLYRGEQMAAEWISGDQYLLACGAAVSTLLSDSAIELLMPRILYGVGVSLELQCAGTPQAHCIRTPNRRGASGVYSVPYFTGPDSAPHVLLGATSLLSPEPVYAVTPEIINGLHRQAVNEIDVSLADARIVRSNLGWRPVSEDGYPVLGRTSLENLLIASGTHRDGFHLAPVISAHLASVLYDQVTDSRWRWFVPERKPLNCMATV